LLSKFPTVFPTFLGKNSAKICKDSGWNFPALIPSYSCHGLWQGTPVGSKCFTFLVITVRWCTLAVAAIRLSAPVFPSPALMLPHSSAIAVEIGRMRSP